MPKLGSFGAAVREFDPDAERDTFDFFDETFTVASIIPGMLTLKVGAGLAGHLTSAEQDATVYEALRCALTPLAAEGEEPDTTQFDRFHHLAVERRCSEMDLVTLVLTLIGAQAGKATAPPPTSPPGSSPTSPSSSSSASDTPASSRLRPIDEVLAS